MTLNELFVNWWAGKGVFQIFDEDDLPWDADLNLGLTLDFHANIAGNREIGGLLAKIRETHPAAFLYIPPLLPADREIIDILASTIIANYGRRWAKMWATMELQYNPIENYDATESETITKTGTTSGTDNLTRSSQTSSSETTSDSTTIAQADHSVTDGSVNETKTLSITKGDLASDTKSVQGFNSTGSTYNPSEKTEHTDNATETDTDTAGRADHTVTDSTTNSSTTGSGSRTGSGTESGTDSRTMSGSSSDSTTRSFSRHGNIGVTTSQQMIQSERELWQYKFFRDTVYPDLMEFMTLKIY